MSSRRNFFRKTQRRKWKEGSYRNPYFEEGKRSLKQPLIASGSVLGCLVLIGFFLYTPLLRIQTYAVEGVEFIDPIQIEDTAKNLLKKRKFLVVPKNHILFLSEEAISQDLFTLFRLDQLEVTREGRVLRIRVAERISRVIWETRHQQYVVDETGVILSAIEPSPEPVVVEESEGEPEETITTPKLTIIRSLQEESVGVGDQVLEEVTMGHILELLLTLRESPLQVTSLEIDSLETHFLRVNIEEGYGVFFDPTIPMQEQFERLITVLKGESVDPTAYEYIDVRFGERVYIKDR